MKSEEARKQFKPIVEEDVIYEESDIYLEGLPEVAVPKEGKKKGKAKKGKQETEEKNPPNSPYTIDCKLLESFGNELDMSAAQEVSARPIADSSVA